MDVAEFRAMAIQSAKTYYQFLEQNNKGVATVSIRAIRPTGNGAFLLTLGSRLSAMAAADLDGLQFRFKGQDYQAVKDIKPIEYSAVSATLLVKPDSRLQSEFSSLKPDELTIYSDLKFLVKRVESWYTDHGHEIIPPGSIPSSPPPVVTPVAEPSDEQLIAISGALSSPLSYIWGAPGTGKTRVVLASCAVSLLNAQQKILILAPTNNALEQVLSSLMPALLKSGIPQDQVLRLGTPTARFAEQYPAVCEVAGVSRQLAQLSSEIEQMQECLKYRSSREIFESAQNSITRLLTQFQEQSSAYCLEQEKLEALTLNGAQHRAKDALLRRETVRLLSELESAQKALSSPTASIKKFLLPGWYSRRCSQEEHSARLLQENNAQLEELSALLADLDRQQAEHTARRDSLAAQLSQIKVDLNQVTSFWPSLQSAACQLTESDPSGSARVLLSTLEEGKQLLAEKANAYASYDSYSIAELSTLLEELSAKEEKLQSATTEERLGHVCIVAATLDKFLALYLPSTSFHPDHVFLDEAGYCSLIKGVPLLSLGVPVTLLGDHMQLPPICEISDSGLKKVECQSVCLWAQSAIYLDSVFLSTPEQISRGYHKVEPPPYFDIQKFDLTATYRFGSALSSILAGYIYSPQFHSVSGGDTELFVLDAPKCRESQTRVSSAEVEAIARFLATESIGDYVILTPYRKQIAALTKQFPSASRNERVLTVHASQGREWDTVFFSVVDTTDMWFVDSLRAITKGRQVINTAVSRAKKRLILVCDCKFWLGQPKQLIGQLVYAAQKIEPRCLP